MESLGELFCPSGVEKTYKEFESKYRLISEFLELNAQKEGFNIYEFFGWVGAFGSKQLELIEKFSKQGQEEHEIALWLIDHHRCKLIEFEKEIRGPNVKERKSRRSGKNSGSG